MRKWYVQGQHNNLYVGGYKISVFGTIILVDFDSSTTIVYKVKTKKQLAAAFMVVYWLGLWCVDRWTPVRSSLY